MNMTVIPPREPMTIRLLATEYHEMRDRETFWRRSCALSFAAGLFVSALVAVLIVVL